MKTIKEIVQQDIDEAKEDGYTEYLNDVLSNGCQSGMVSDLIYYSDTCKFYEDHKDEIKTLLNDIFGDWVDSEYGIDETVSTEWSFSGIFGDKWDNTDPLIQETNNQNLLAWFGYEETASRMQY